ncbi:hypothetical protein [Gimesia fumaroli]|uniref:Phage head-tail joining protein domain-containing protein n=1 Tax=Gimesia fumaroli TaxID=2527976 RepID=A0A518IKT5_9PLAN|nr:hypothetical protein [Gimesia fumaroli]QDV53703.1 hypothetical protein Enr17x_57840 [Gimesia fumaroli]
MSVIENVLAVGLQAGLSLSATSLTYTQGDNTIEDLKGTQGSTDWRTTDSDGFPLRKTSVDWLVKAADLVVGGNPVLPKRNDLITRVLGGVSRVYQVLPFGDDEQEYRFMDAGRTMLRVHTKLMTEDEV